jgi:hypothetical protein
LIDLHLISLGEEEETACILGKYTKHATYVHVGHNRISHNDDDTFRPTGTCPTADLAGMRIGPCCPSVPQQKDWISGANSHIRREEEWQAAAVGNEPEAVDVPQRC